MITVALDTTPLATGHAHRGIGKYTQALLTHLQARREVEVITSTQLQNNPDLKPNVYHYPYFDLFFKTLHIKKQVATVVTIHDVIPLKFPQYYKPGLKGRANLWRQRWLVQQVDAVITDSLASKSDIRRYLGVPEAKLFVVPLAAQPDVVKVSPADLARVRHQYHLPTPYMLYVGDINYNKNLPQLIKALKFIPDHIHLVCVGRNFVPQPIPEWKWIETQIALSNVESRVHFLTDVGGEQVNDLSAIYAGAMAYVQPSLAEGFGLPVLEAMQCRVPVVISPAEALVEVAGGHAVVAGFQAEELAQGVSTVAAWSERTRASKVKAAAEWAQTFDWNLVAKETSKVYKHVATPIRH